jgi:hypothetical protein
MFNLSPEAVKQAHQYLLGPSAEDCRADLELIREDPATHLSSAITDCFLEQDLAEEEVELVVRHLRRCGYCRTYINECLELSATELTHPAYQWIRDAEQWAQMAAAGERATSAARASLHAAGVAPVYKKDGVLVEELPDGSTRPYVKGAGCEEP